MQRPVHPKLRKAIAVFGATAAIAVVLSAGTAVAAYAQVDCPSGDVCLYPGDDGNGTPLEYYHYGSYNLSDEYGYHYIVNNQTGGAVFRLCTGYNGQGCGGRYGPGSYEADLTPINSIRLEA